MNMQDTPCVNPHPKEKEKKNKNTLKSDTTASDPKLGIIKRQHIQISYAQKAIHTKEVIATK